jgi:serine/threonine-protein kinase
MKKYTINKPRVKKFAYILGGLMIFYIVMNYAVMPWYVSSPEVTVPKVVGMSAEQAESTLKDNHLSVVIGDTVSDKRFPRGTIVMQRPFANDVVKKGRTIYLVISGGEPMAVVPEIVGKSITDSKFQLEKVGLKVGEITYVSSSTPKDIVVKQQYVGGYSIVKGTGVGVSVSLGTVEGNIEIPDLIGKSYTEAEAALTGLKLKVGKINYQPSFTLLPNTVIDQYPSKGARLNEGDKVDLFITKIVETKEDEEKALPR